MAEEEYAILAEGHSWKSVADSSDDSDHNTNHQTHSPQSSRLLNRKRRREVDGETLSRPQPQQQRSQRSLEWNDSGFELDESSDASTKTTKSRKAKAKRKTKAKSSSSTSHVRPRPSGLESESKALVPASSSSLISSHKPSYDCQLTDSLALDPFFSLLPPPSVSDQFCFICEILVSGPSPQGNAPRQKLMNALDRYGTATRSSVISHVRRVYEEEYRQFNPHYPPWTDRSIINHIQYHGNTASHRLLRQEINDFDKCIDIHKRNGLKKMDPITQSECIDHEGMELYMKMLRTRVGLTNILIRATAL